MFYLLKVKKNLFEINMKLPDVKHKKRKTTQAAVPAVGK
jgi:hypothetical protein